MWQFKKQKPTSTIPTTNKFWADIDIDSEKAETSETKDFTAAETSALERRLNNPNKLKRAKCYICSEVGHIARICPLNKGQKKKKDYSTTAASKDAGKMNTNYDNAETLGQSASNHEKSKSTTSTAKEDDNAETSGQCKSYTETNKAETPKEREIAASEAEKPKKKLLNITVKCYICHQKGHRQNACPLKDKQDALAGASSTECTDQMSKDARCTFCGVQGHNFQTCPVKKWHVGPGSKESESEKEGNIYDFIDLSAEQPETDNQTTKGIPIGVCKQITEAQRSELKKQKTIRKRMNQSMKRRRAALLKKVPMFLRATAPENHLTVFESQTIIAGNQSMPVPMPVVIENHPVVSGDHPVAYQPVAPQNYPFPDPNQANVAGFIAMQGYTRFPSGIPKSFLTPQHTEQLLPQNMQQRIPTIQRQTQQQPVQPIVPEPSPVPDWQTQHTFMPISIEKNPPVESTRMSTQGETTETEITQAYSPSDVYGDMRNELGSTEPHEGSESPDPQGQKRLSAFQRLGPATQKKPKLTINLSCDKGQPVREVVDETEETVEEYTPVHLRNDVTTSTDETVMKYLHLWPWKRTVHERRTASFRTSKSAMLLELEQMVESYEKDNSFILITVTHYPKHWTKEMVFDVVLEQINVIPCFIEFTPKECKFFVIRSKPALMAIHKLGFRIRKEDLELRLRISLTLLTQNQIDFLPRLELRKRLGMGYDGERKLDLQEFTLKSDISHFIYFPLSALSNQTDLIQLRSVVDWERLTELNLSRNRLTSINGFELSTTCPKLKVLDLSHNYLGRVTVLLQSRSLPLRSLSLEGNPLCHDYIDPRQYVDNVRAMFPTLRELDGVSLTLKGDLPAFKKNYCIYGADSIIEKFLDVYFPLLELQPSERQLIGDMYDENALMMVIYRYKYIRRLFRISSINSKFVADGVKDVIQGATSITKYINKWPVFKHDPFTFTVDVIFHSDTTTVVKICGMLKLTAESLAEDEHIMSFSRTTVLHRTDSMEYKILNDLLLWDEPSKECAANAFQITKIRSRKLYVDFEFDPNPDEETKEKLVLIFEQLTELDTDCSRKCLERKEWNLKEALDHFIQLLKLNDLSSIELN
ncbi:uncharacterized protein LOC106139578 isoform X2 [Amyelois transitella]|uniref:uncharacterized protein LOC106139578 isoform X2 n=1 Tax=Amyelois transitella TaxID=680683 RepID=UPI00298FEDFD|nr:uncharacterized protein LOC106139578 isoform X2 [Amyelois transitella]